MKCPHCGRTDRQYKVGTNPSGSQRYLCDWCHRKYTPQPHHQGYAVEVRQHALRLYVDGINLRRIGRMLGVTHQSVSNWVPAYARQLPELPPTPASPQAVHELDELYTFVASKKTVSTSLPKSTAPPAVSSVGRWRLTASGPRCKTWCPPRLRLRSTTASPCMQRWCMPRDRMKLCRTKVKPTPSKRTMQNYAIISRAWAAAPVVSLARCMRYAMQSPCSSLPGIVGNSPNAHIHTTPTTLLISCTHDFCHSCTDSCPSTI